jgi:hypothetical protein
MMPLSTQSVRADQPAVLLSQISDVCGKQNIYLTKTAMKVVSIEGHTSLVMKKSSSRVVLFNFERRLAYETDAKLWRGMTPWANLAERDPELSNQASQSEKTLSLDTTHVIMDLPKPHHSMRGADYWYSQALSISPDASAVLHRNYVLPLKPGIPIKYLRRADGQVTNPLRTTAVKYVTVSNDFFDVPPSLHMAKNPQEVMTAARQELIKDLVDNLR